MMFGDLGAIPITVSPYNCELVFDRWKAWPKSKRKRIRRKWQKRFGCVMKCVSEKVFQVGRSGPFIMCPHTFDKLKSTMEKRCVGN